MKAAKPYLPFLVYLLVSSPVLLADPPGTPLYHFDAAGSGVVTNGGVVTGWADETGQLTAGTNSGGATLTSFAFPAGTFPTVDLDGGHYANGAGFSYGPQVETEFGTNDEFSIFSVVVPRDQQSSFLVTNFNSSTGMGLGISDSLANSIKFWTSAGSASLESRLTDYTPGEPITVAGLWYGNGDGTGDKYSFVDGVEIAADTGGPQAPSYNGNNDFRIGSVGGLVQDWNGQIAEILVYQDATVGEDVENYFRGKYFEKAPTPPKNYNVVSTSSAPTIDGVVGAGEWDGIDATGNFSLLRNPEGTPDDHNWQIKASWDQDNMYLLFTTDYDGWVEGHGAGAEVECDGALNCGGSNFGGNPDSINLYIAPAV